MANFTYRQERKNKAKEYFLNGTKSMYTTDKPTVPFTMFVMLTGVLSTSNNMPQFISQVVTELEKFTQAGYIAPNNIGDFINYTWASVKIQHENGDKYYSFLFIPQKEYENTVMDVVLSDHKDSKNNILILQSVFQ